MSAVIESLPRTERSIKAMATTMRNGITLLSDGYEVVAGYSEDMPQYVVTGPDRQKYIVTYDDRHERFACTCQGHTYIGLCKHLVAVHLYKDRIDRPAAAA